MKSKPLAKPINCWSGIVVYNPDHPTLDRLIQSLLAQASHVALFDNGGLNPKILQSWRINQHRISILGNGDNLGIGVALNIMAKAAVSNNADYFWTFDQDSNPSCSLLADLTTPEVLEETDDSVAAIAPIFRDSRSGQILPIFKIGKFWIKKITLQPGNPIQKADIVITSGMLIPVNALKVVGPFNEPYFIDHIDTEWCLRARCAGQKIYVCPNAIMDHQLSDEAPKQVLGRLVLKYSPIRRYYIFRNSTALATSLKTPLSMRIYLLLTLVYRLPLNICIDTYRLKSMRSMIIGITHGLINRLGRIN